MIIDAGNLSDTEDVQVSDPGEGEDLKSPESQPHIENTCLPVAMDIELNNNHCSDAQEVAQKIDDESDVIGKTDGIEFVSEGASISAGKESVVVSSMSEAVITEIIESIISDVTKDLDQGNEIVSNVVVKEIKEIIEEGVTETDIPKVSDVIDVEYNDTEVSKESGFDLKEFVEIGNFSGLEDVNGNVINKSRDGEVYQQVDVMPEVICKKDEEDLEELKEVVKCRESKPDVITAPGADDAQVYEADKKKDTDIPTDSAHHHLSITDLVETSLGTEEEDCEAGPVLADEQDDDQYSNVSASEVEDVEENAEVFKPLKNVQVLEAGENVDVNKTGVEDDEASREIERVGEVSVKIVASDETEEKLFTGSGGFMFLLRDRPGKQKLTIKKMLDFKVSEPVGICLLADGSLAVACRNQNAVLRFSKTGNELISLESRLGFNRPTDILQLRTGEVVVRDHIGLQLFDEEHRFQTTIGEEHCNRYYGLAEDNQGRIITINTNASLREPGKGSTTKRGHTDIFYFTKAGDLVYTVSLADIVMEEMRPKSMCRYLDYSENKLLVVDMGLNCIYSLFHKDGEEVAAVCGDFGDQVGEFDSPAGIAVDEFGNSIVADSGNDRLQLIDSEHNIIGPLKVSQKQPPTSPLDVN